MSRPKGPALAPALRTIEALLRHPEGLTVPELGDELGMVDSGAYARLRALDVGGFVEQVCPGGHPNPVRWRLGPRIRSIIMDAGDAWRRELVGDPSPFGNPAFPREID